MIGGIICLVGFFLVAMGGGRKKRNGELEGVSCSAIILGFILIFAGVGIASMGL